MLDKNPWQAGQRTKQIPFKCFKKKKRKERKKDGHPIFEQFFLPH